MIQPINAVACLIMSAAALSTATPSVTHADVFVIANSSVTLGADDIKLIYTGDREFVGAQKIKPVDNHAAQSEFLSKVLGLNAGRYDSLWTMKSFRDGLVPPTLKPTDAEVIAYVQNTPGAIGYVTSTPPAGAVILKKF